MPLVLPCFFVCDDYVYPAACTLVTVAAAPTAAAIARTAAPIAAAVLGGAAPTATPSTAVALVVNRSAALVAAPLAAATNIDAAAPT